jgi:tetratricopeptide (TPR) repeat protein
MTRFDSIFQFIIPLLEGQTSNVGTSGIDVAKGLSTLFAIVVIPVLLILFFVLRSVYRHTIGKKLKTTLIQDYKKEAEGYERSGKFVSAANIYEKRLKDIEKAAGLYERGKDYRQAASLYEQLGIIQKAKGMYEKDGNFASAAEAAIREGNYDDAARLYNRAGRKVDAAMVLERAGKRMSAIKIYREAGEYKKASVLLEEEGMSREAVEMFGLSLREQKPESSNMDDFYTYATMLEKIDDVQTALTVFKGIDKADPTFRDVRERINALATPTDLKNLSKSKK